MKKILKVMNDLVSKGKKVLVLTQSNDLARAFLYDNPGKWRAHLNEKYWPGSLKISECIGKIEFTEEPSEVGFNSYGDNVTFSKLPVNLGPHYAVIQTQFKSPIVKLDEYACHSSNVKGSVFFPDDPEKWRYVLDVIGDDSTVIMDDIKYVSAERAVIARSFCNPLEMCAMHDVDEILVSKNMLWDQIPTINQCQSVMESMSMIESTMRGSSVDADWVSRHAIVNAFAIPKTLELLKFMKCVKEKIMDASTVVIHKKPPHPADIEYGSIPEGTFSMIEIRKLLGSNALKILKRYENNGIVFGYNDRRHKFYKPVADATRDKYNEATHTLSAMTHAWRSLEGNAKWLNNAVHELVRNMYATNEVYVTSEDMQEIERIGEVVNVKL